MKHFSPQRIGIVAEWNPFHLGHQKLVQALKETYPTAALISVMSGSFVQRGEPAVFDKWLRAKWAVLAGVDCVVELPTRLVLQSADHFAAAGVKLLADLECDAIAFGTESFSAEELFGAADILEAPDFSENLRAVLATGLPYSRAVNAVLSEKNPALADGLSRPNNLLGIQYARAVRELALPMTLLPLHRDTSPAAPSATAIRNKIAAGKFPENIPDEERQDLETRLAKGSVTDFSRYEDACHLRARLLSIETLKASALFSEGLEHKWRNETKQISFSEMLAAIKSKRYLTSRLRRLGAALLLSDRAPSPFANTAPVAYARLLALRKSKSFLLRQTQIPVVTSFAKALRTENKETVRDLLLDAQATDIAAWCQKQETERKGGADYTRSPEILP